MMEVDSQEHLDIPMHGTNDGPMAILLSEFALWSESNSFFISLIKESICDDGRFRIDLCMDDDTEFVLYCPSAYPKSLEDHFFVEVPPSTLQYWCNALNEFILDSVTELSLEAVLNKAVSLYHNRKKIATMVSYSSSSDSENGDVEFSDEFMILGEEDDDWEHKMLQLKKRWRMKEAQLRAITKSPKTSDMFDGNVKDHPKQIFSNSAASGILTNDLVGILESRKETGINAEAVDDNIYKWAVYLSKFNNHDCLNQDLQELSKKFGYDYIELQLDFTMDLYPFYPPIIKVVRPRLQGWMMMRVSSMSMLKLSHWNPAREMKDVLLEIKEYLGNFARLDLNSERNDRQRYQQGAYIYIENHLLCLAWVSEIESRANREYPQPPRDIQEAMLGTSPAIPDKKISVTVKPSLKIPAGTGYSTSGHIGWDVKAHFAAQKEKDKQIEQVLQKILNELIIFNKINSKSLSPTSVLTESTNKTYSSFFNQPSCSNSESSSEIVAENTDSIIKPTEDLFNIIEGSTLVPFLESKLTGDSFFEICQHRSVYRCIVDILIELASQPNLVPLLWTLPDQVQSLYTLISKLDLEASDILNRIDKATSSSNGSAWTKRSGKSGRIAPANFDSDAAQNPSEEEVFARDFHSMSQTVFSALEKLGLPVGCKSNIDCEEVSQSNGNGQSLDTRYKEALKELQFLSCDIEVSGASAHYFSEKFKKAYTPTPTQMMRIAQEMAALSNSLPLDLGSSIFVRTDDAKCTLLRALIIGPEGTPYANGCFVFDIFFPSNYPLGPPNVQLRTTGGGTVRFNPNLYNSGAVCLSLLGTWKGLQGESWIQTSTLLQVLVSIQSLILVAEPYFNEPGFEVLIGTSRGYSASLSYNVDIMTQTIRHAMVAQLQRPESGFKDVITRHFLIKKNVILQDIQNFMTKCPVNSALTLANNKLVAELDKLSTQNKHTPLTSTNQKE